ncbi:MAG: glutamine-hydrolyzing carbamoyl-phosphate synthase small subunit [Bacteroidota bacterium]|nr:glutamine-hydrolyzing carbamoyl-phosphate synthase small subunit [Bacteroidota bacterium]
MNVEKQSPAYLLLEDGTLFKGFAAGIEGTTGGEICFNTGMTGYQEIFTDPSYFGQIMVMSNVHIANYGVKNTESESAQVQISGLVCRNFSSQFSRQQADGSLQDYLVQNKIVCIHSIDTRALVRMIREKGAMNAVISTEVHDPQKLKEFLDNVPNMIGLELASKVSCTSAYEINSAANDKKVAVLDFGIKRSILKQMELNGFRIKVFPARTSFAEMNSWQPDAFFLSNGPGDPDPMDYAVQTVSEMIESQKPIFGICLGHQILALAFGVATYKMHHGHRGINHPVLNLESGLCEITSQNHGFSVDQQALEKRDDILSLSHRNLNDNSVEGIKHKQLPVFSVQYHPEAGPGPHDSRYLFQKFSSLVSRVIA